MLCILYTVLSATLLSIHCFYQYCQLPPLQCPSSRSFDLARLFLTPTALARTVFGLLETALDYKSVNNSVQSATQLSSSLPEVASLVI
jgi:hypothetical protein